MKKLRQLIKEHIKLIIKEMEQERPHFPERRYQRLNSNLTDFPGDYPQFAVEVEKAIDFLIHKVFVKSQYNFAIYIKCPQVYTAKNIDVFKRPSKGNVIWINCKGNLLLTIFFDYIGRSNEDNRSDFRISFDQLKNYIVTNNKYVLTDSDMKELKKFDPSYKKPVEKEESNEILMLINGTKYLFDPEKGLIYKKNDPKKVYDAYKLIGDEYPDFMIDDNQKEVILTNIK